MKTTATSTLNKQNAVQVSPHLQLAISFIRPIEPRHAIFALKQEEAKLVYDEKYCSFDLVTYHHADATEITTLDAFIDLDGACFHQGHFFAGQCCELMLDGSPLATVTVVEVKCPALSHWDWKKAPAYLNDPAVHFNAEQTDTFLINLEFELLDLGFTRDYSIIKPKTGDYGLEVRLYSSVEALDQDQAQQILDALYSLPYDFYQLKPGFYQLDAGEQLENFECSFIIGDGSQYITGRFIVI